MDSTPALGVPSTATRVTVARQSTGLQCADMSSAAVARVRVWAPIAVCVGIAIVLGSFKLNGSSVAVYGLGNRPDAGSVRPIRSDEYLGRTPMVLRQAELDFPETMQVGMGRHSSGVLSDLPVKSWQLLLSPQRLAYFVVDVERAFAIEWWLVLAAPAVGVYALLYVLTKRSWLSILAGVTVATSSGVLWWAIPATGMSIGYSSVACAAAVVAVRARTGRRAFAYAVLAGWSLAGLITQLYLPWTLTHGIVFGAVAVVVWQHQRIGRAASIRLLAVIGSVCAILVVAFAVKQHEALSAITNSVYPGKRRAASGNVSLANLFSAPFDHFVGVTPLATVSGSNQSDTAVGMMFWLPILIRDGTLWNWRRSSDVLARACAALMATVLLLSAWALLPVPSWIGSITLLDRVLPRRVFLPLTTASIVLAVLYAITQGRQSRSEHGDRSLFGAGVMTAVTAWAGLTMRVNDLPVSRGWVTVLALGTGAISLAFLRGKALPALVCTAALASSSTLRINPIQVGLGPLLRAPLMRQIDEVSARYPGDAGWVLSGGDTNGYGVLLASGVPLVSGLSLYPDDDAWEILDPSREYEPVWSRFARVSFSIVPGDEAPVISLPYEDAVSVEIGACRSELAELGVRLVVAQEPISSPCLTLLEPRPQRGDEFLIYELSTSTP